MPFQNTRLMRVFFCVKALNIMQEKIATAILEAIVLKAGREYLEGEGFIEITPPRVVRASGACENVNTLFGVSSDNNHKWFLNKGKPCSAYLAQTGQLYLEALVPYLKKAYCIGPSFRAEIGVDNRHLTEFTMTEIEFKGNFDQLLCYIENYIATIAKTIITLSESKLKLMKLTNKDTERLSLAKIPFPRVTYDKAIELLGLKWGDDIPNIKEQELITMFGGKPVFVTRYPDPMWRHGKEIEVEKFFNMLPDPKNPGRVLSADLILPIAGESVGSAARVHNPKMLVDRLLNSRMFKRLQLIGGSIDDFEWYIKQVNTKTVPHAGCGFGMARIMRWIIGGDDIKECVTFPSNQSNII